MRPKLLTHPLRLIVGLCMLGLGFGTSLNLVFLVMSGLPDFEMLVAGFLAGGIFLVVLGLPAWGILYWLRAPAALVALVFGIPSAMAMLIAGYFAVWRPQAQFGLNPSLGEFAVRVFIPVGLFAALAAGTAWLSWKVAYRMEGRQATGELFS